MQQRNSARYHVGQLLRQLACFVQIHCGNDLALLLSSGFVPTRDNKKRIGPLPGPRNVHTTYTGNSGEVMLRMKKVHGMVCYTVEIAESADGPWVEYRSCSSSRILVQGLVPTEIYWLRVRVTGTAGPGPWSRTVRVIAL